MGLRLPDQLGPAGAPGDPQDFGQERAEQEFLPRPITIEEAIGRQLDRIAYLRSVGLPWSEAVYQLRDMVTGLEDDEFRDGIPPKKRKEMESLPELEQIELKKRYKEDGWETHSVRAYRTRSNTIVYRPTAEELSTGLRIIMRLLAREGITWRAKNVSILKEWEP